MSHPEPVERDNEAERPVIEAIQCGDAYAMSEFVRRHDRWVRGVVFGVLGRRADLEDVAQQVWMKVWREARQLEDTGRWRPWLYRIARNAAFDAGRSIKRRQSAMDHLAARTGRTAPTAPSAADRLRAEEQLVAMLGAIEALPAIYREPFVLKHLEGWSYKDIGELLDLPTDTVETRLVRARRLLRESLAGRL
ncbi:MAG TPA: RNA polymerase sigma factor [Phycisphaerae bacterium]|nr:RNA polymerase sigma factor [Phycisphaerae bacterium]